MVRRLLSILISLLLIGALLPAHAVAGAPGQAVVQVVALEYVYVAGAPTANAGGVTALNKVYGTCGWASFYLYPRGSGHALFAADAGTSHWAPIVFVDWRMDWSNSTAGTYGWIAGQSVQFSWTWGVDVDRYTSTGYVSGRVSTLFVRHSDGTVCIGLYPSDISWIT